MLDKSTIESLVKLANENMALMDGTTGPVKKLFDEGEIVFGVWQDPDEQYGVGCLLLKGYELLRECVSNGENIVARTTAIPCECYEQAIAAKRVFGSS
jgi:hypothetical protein